mgnify:CR=1 FL=1
MTIAYIALGSNLASPLEQVNAAVAALAQWLIGAGLAPARYVASQGTALGRAGRVYVEQDGGTIWVGCTSVTCMAGEVLL